jgi:hypothetical protein
MKLFRLNDKYSIACEWVNTNYGFKHTAHLISNGIEIDDAKATYHNRIWERFEYQTVLRILLNETTMLTDKEKKRFKKKVT